MLLAVSVLIAASGPVAMPQPEPAPASQAPTPAAEQVQGPVVAAPAPKPAAKGGVPKLTVGGVTLTPRGRLHLDAGNVDGPADASRVFDGVDLEMRRLRLGADAKLSDSVKVRLDADFGGDTVEIVDAFAQFAKGPLTVTIGQHNIAQSLEELTSSNDYSFLERAAFTEAFGFERRIGVSADYLVNDIMLIQAGVSTENLTEISDGETSAWGLNGRAVVMPKLGETQLHLGVHASWRDQPNGGGEVRYRQRPYLHDVSTRPISTPRIAATDERGLGIEAAVLSGRFHAQVEAHWQTVDPVAAVAKPTFFGAGIEAGVFLTDDARGYKAGIFRGPKVKRSVVDGGPGAVQLVIRHDRLDLNDAGIVGGTQTGWMAGLNWWLVPQVRVMLNYARLDYADAVVPVGGRRDYRLNAVGSRLQIAF